MRWNVAVAALASSWGFVSILVREIELDAEVLVFYRCFLAVAALGFGLLAARRLDLLTRPSNRWALALGTTLGLHWFLFFETIKLSSVVLAILMAYAAPILVALVGPFVLPERRSSVALAALVPAAGGLALVALAGEGSTHVRPLAIATGIGTALTYAALVIGTKRIASQVSAAGLTFWNYLLSGLVVMPLVLLDGRVFPEPGEVGYLLLLGVVFTAVSGYLYIWLLRRVTAQAMGLLAYLEPVSAALLAWAILDEPLGWKTILGGALVIGSGLAVVLFEPAEPQPLEAPPLAEPVKTASG